MSNYRDEGWRGGEDRSKDRLTLLDLVRNNTLDLKLTALLWLLMEKKSSIIVAAGPRLSGKSTMLTAIVDFIPPSTVRAYTRGQNEDFSFLPETDASNTCIIVPELSDHTPDYLWGDPVRTLFEAMGEGYMLASTMHADSAEEVVDMLEGPPLHLPHSHVINLRAVVNLCMVYGENGILRRVNKVTLVSPGPEFTALARWEADEDTFVHEDSSAAQAKVEARLGMASGELAADLARRAETLDTWLKDDTIDAGRLRELIIEHYESR
ncbi:MAG: hypothetical protein IIC22_03340 [Chloroflexi bacterium]|nr:hypothetical protein [Chloroflexota bacterium]